MQTDDELVKEILAGSKSAAEVLINRHYQAIFAYIYRKIGGDKELAKDLTQEIFIKVMKSIKTYNERGKFKHWLLTIAVNYCRDYYRSSQFKHSNTDELDTDITDPQGNVLSLLERNMKRKQVRDAIEELPDYQKEVILLKFFHELKIREIAEMTNSKEATVKSRLKQGLMKLRTYFEGSEEDVEAKSRF